MIAAQASTPGRLATLPPLLERFLALEATDLHLSPGEPPYVRIHGALQPVPGEPPVSPAELDQLARIFLGDERLARFRQERECDCAVGLPGGQRLRINASVQRGALSLAIRLLPSQLRKLDALGLPPSIVAQICGLHQGLVLVTGATGSGKTTTLASILDELNASRTSHIVTIEEPIEYIHRSRRCRVTQREVGVDTASFAEALRRSLRQDPDIVLVGEMRDLETIRAALTLSETGHLTFGTLHTAEAFQTVTRIIGAFPPSEQEQVRAILATTLRVVICQQLIPTSDVAGRALVAETLVATPAVRALIRENKLHQIPSTIQTGATLGMITMNQSITRLVGEGRIGRDTALAHSPDPQDLAEELRHPH